MAGRIPKQFIDDLLARTDIVEVIDHYVPLKKTGSNYSARCPFHQEKTPSFTVSAEKQFYHCFGCGAHGSAIGFVMEYERLDFVEAVHELAQRLGLQVPTEERGGSHSPDTRAQRDKLYAVLGLAEQFYRRQLKQHPMATQAIEYLKKRGLSGDVAAAFGIGFAPPGWDNLLRHCLENGFDESTMLAAGLIIKRENETGYYDRFRHRITFPIRDHRGRVIGFGGRVLNDELPKYLNSPETDVFHKGQELYGLYEARKALRELDQIIVVEGYMDVVALAQFGLKQAVATLGTSATTAHLEKLFRVTPQVVFCFDGDRAGRDAAWRALEHALPVLREGVEARFMFLPEGEDPDSLVRKIGAEALLKQVATAQPLSKFFLESLGRGLDTSTLDGRARLVDLARPYIAKIPEGAFKTLLGEELARRAQTSPERLGLAPATHSSPKTAQKVANGASGQNRTLIRGVVLQLLHRPQLAQKTPDTAGLRQAPLGGIDFLCDLLDFLKSRPNITTGAIVEHWRDTEFGTYLDRLAQKQMVVSDQQLEREFVDAIDKIRGRVYSKRIESLLQKPLEALTEQEREELRGISKPRAADSKLPAS